MSRFAQALKGLLDDTKLFTRDEWADILTVDEAEIEEWVEDRKLPHHSALRSLVSCAKEHDRISDEPFLQWDDMARLPFSQVSPLWKERGTVRHYMVQPAIEGFLRSLRCLDPDDQEAVLLSAAQRCHKIILAKTKEE